jgi:hypothetical protein
MTDSIRPDEKTGRSEFAFASEQLVSQVIPTPDAAVRLRPLGLLNNRIEGGLWADRRRVNHDITIPFGAEQLEKVGNLLNLKLAAGASGKYRGADDDTGNTAPFLDSDVHKWLEAVGWELAQFPDEKLLALAEPIIDLVAKAQRADGYVDSYYQAALPGKEFTNPEWASGPGCDCLAPRPRRRPPDGDRPAFRCADRGRAWPRQARMDLRPS